LAPSDLKPETDFRDLLRKPANLFGYSYVYFLGVAVLLGLLYVRNLSGIGKNTVAPLVPADSAAFTQDIPFKTPSLLPPVDVTKAGFPTDSLLARGREIFRANCASCHGDNGMGDGPAGATLKPGPRNFHSLAGWTNGPKVSQIYRTLEEGIVRNGMASYSHLAPGDRFALAHVVRSYSTGAPTDTPEELQALETTYQLARGRSTAGQIPVRRAEALLLGESAQTAARLAASLRRVHADSSIAGARLLAGSARNLERVLITCTGAQGAPDAAGFVRMVSEDPIAFGFNPSVVSLNTAEWMQLHAYLVGLARAASEGGSSS
jgi:mono/diheme cytochrome c family protein